LRTNSSAECGGSARPLAGRLRGIGFVGLLAVAGIYLGSVLIPGLGALLVLAWAWRSRTPWQEIGLAPPESWMATIALGIAIGVALRLLMKFAVLPLLGAPPVNQAFEYLAGNTAALPLAILVMGFVAAFGEEVVMRGFLFERLIRLLGRSKASMFFIVLVTSLVFGIGHYPLQGLAGAQNATLMGLVFGTLYVLTGRVWLPVAVHSAFNIAGLTMIYLRL
jgi:hypothetical protein